MPGTRPDSIVRWSILSTAEKGQMWPSMKTRTGQLQHKSRPHAARTTTGDIWLHRAQQKRCDRVALQTL